MLDVNHNNLPLLNFDHVVKHTFSMIRCFRLLRSRRFRLEGEGNAERVYTLGSGGRDFLTGELGLPVCWYFRPHKIKHFSHAHVVYALLLTRFLISAVEQALGWERLKTLVSEAETTIANSAG